MMMTCIWIAAVELRLMEKDRCATQSIAVTDGLSVFVC